MNAYKINEMLEAMRTTEDDSIYIRVNSDTYMEIYVHDIGRHDWRGVEAIEDYLNTLECIECGDEWEIEKVYEVGDVIITFKKDSDERWA